MVLETIKGAVELYTPEQFLKLLYKKTAEDIVLSGRHLKLYGLLPLSETNKEQSYKEAHIFSFDPPVYSSFFVLMLTRGSLQFNLIDHLPDDFKKSAENIAHFSVGNFHPQGGKLSINPGPDKTQIDCWMNNLWFWQRGQEIKNWPSDEILTDNGLLAYSELIRQIATGLP